MANVIPTSNAAQVDEMHLVYLQGGAKRAMAPHVVYQDAGCPHEGCRHSLHAIDFRLEAFGRTVHDPLVRAWWDDVGFVGRCPACHGWIHFTVRGKRAIEDDEAGALPQLPPNWADQAVIL
jgi:hypothetical protein